ncbi:MAG: vWA domain-containing protein [Clostridia bacterium]
MTAIAESQYSNLALDLVIVIDQSGSMGSLQGRNVESKGSDPYGYRLDAASIVLGMCDAENSDAAVILFNTDVRKGKYLNELMDISMKNSATTRINIINNLKKFNQTSYVNGYTDIGAAMVRAVDLIRENPSERQPMILLLTDGDFRTDSKRTVEESKQDFDGAIHDAQALGIKVYTVALSYGSTVYDTTRLEEAANATQGLFSSVNSYHDLPEIFNNFFAHEIESDVVNLQGQAVTLDNGDIAIDVNVPNMSVTEANIMLLTNHLKNINLYQPSSDRAIAVNGESIIRLDANYFSLYKIVKPQITGNWRLICTPDERYDNSASINVVFSYDLTTQVALTPDEPHSKYDQITVTAQFITSDGTPSTDTALYLARSDSDGIVASIEVVSLDTDKVWASNLVMDKASDHFEKTVNLAELVEGEMLPSGTYAVRVHFTGDGMNATSNDASFSIVNSLPEQIGTTNLFSDIVIHDPTTKEYKDEKSISLDLNTLVKDPDGETLSYTVKGFDGDDIDDAIIDGSTLTVATKDVSGTQTLTVQAADTEGGSVEIPIRVNITSMRQQISNDYSLVLKADAEPWEKDSGAVVYGTLMQGSKPLDNPTLRDMVVPTCNVTTVTAGAGGEEIKTVDPLEMNVDEATGSFVIRFHTLSTAASYAFDGTAMLHDIPIKLTGCTVPVGNLAPVIDAEYSDSLPKEVSIEPMLWATRNEETTVVSLAQLFKDSQGDALSYRTYALPKNADAGKSAEEWLAEMDSLEPVDWMTLGKDGTLTIRNDSAGTRQILLTATDSDGLATPWIYQQTVLSQEVQVWRLILTVLAIVIAAVILCLLIYYFIIRKPWTRMHGAVGMEVNEATRPNSYPLPTRGRMDTSLTSLHIVEAGRGAAATELRSVGDCCKLRALSGNNIQVRLKGRNRTSFTVMVGDMDLAKRKIVTWTMAEPLTLESAKLGVKIVLNRQSAKSASPFRGVGSAMGSAPSASSSTHTAL